MTENKEKIHIISTGGTIDCVFSPKEYKPVPRDKTAIPDFLKNYIKPHFDIEDSTVSMIDSLYMTDDIRQSVFEKIERISSKYILITHGTDGMIKTSQYVDERTTEKNKVIVLVGAMIPLTGFSPSDAGFNLGFALGNMMHLENGIYICMNGQLFTPHNVQKNIDKSRFEFKEAS